jgi:tRNA (guanine-N7-)-methyltransferase
MTARFVYLVAEIDPFSGPGSTWSQVLASRGRTIPCPERQRMNGTRHHTQEARRRIRSFVRREGRLTPGQQRALDQLWPQFGLASQTPLSLVQAFGRTAPVTLEIGFGNGTSLAEMAAQDPDSDFLGIEVHRPGVGRLLMELERRSIGNVRVFCHDAVDVLEQSIPDAALDRVLLFFPDPWPKKKHHKRRILQPAFVSLIARKLKAGGIFHMATDWEPYAQHMLEVMEASQTFVNCDSKGRYSPRPDYRPVTKFERRGQRLGHAVRDLLYRRA